SSLNADSNTIDRSESENDARGFVVPENNAFGLSFRFLNLHLTLHVPSLLLDCPFLSIPHRFVTNVFRDYEKESVRRALVEDFYRKNHIYQTYEFAQKKKEEYGKLDKAVMWECCKLLNEYVDESDPDLDEPQIEHLLQTAEAIRSDYQNEDWLHLTALIHDLGKVLLHLAFGEEAQWSVVGDTFPLGCAFSESIVHPQVAKENNTTPPPAGLFIIRFHSFYALHRAGDYTYLMNEDKEMLKWLHVRINLEEVKPYYLSLVKKVCHQKLPYFPEKLR
ncbi:hypothetical protein RJ639_004278, partial [Escallonia herrerae]